MLRTVCALSLAALFAVSLAAPTDAQRIRTRERSASAAEAPIVEDEVIVRGRRMSEIENDLRIEIGKFIDEISAVPTGRGLARWDRRVCIGVHNLEGTAAQYIVDRISLLALEVGLKPGEPGCVPEVIIVFTTDGKYLANYLVEERERLLRPTNSGGYHLGIAGMMRFAATEQAVRWWHLSAPVPTGGAASASRIHSDIVDVLWRVLIIVDSTKLTGTTWQQLGDYLALVSLVQVDLETNPRTFDSILNVFANPGAYSGLTDWDRTYVRSLYDFDQQRIPQLQRGVLRNEMLNRALYPEREEE
jgi:hypothetical protein